MITIKLPYTTEHDLVPILKQYSSVLRFSYNRFLEGMKDKEIRLAVKPMKNIDLLNSWFVECALLEGKYVYRRFKKEKVVFGGKYLLKQRATGKISKEEYQLQRLSPVNIQGEVLQHGNRSFTLDLIENNRIILKLNRKEHIEMSLPKLRKNYQKLLYRLEELNNDVKYFEPGYTYSVRFDLKNIYISFEEFKEELNIDLNPNRHIGIDMNPDTIGVSVLENDAVIHAVEYSLKPIFKKIFDENNAASSARMKYLHNKLRFETFEISKSIVELAKRFGCKSVSIEDLKFKQKVSTDQKHNHIGNRKSKNLWKRELFVSNLTKRLSIYGIDLYKVMPAYSSFVGNMQHDYTDPVNASIEIARRGYEWNVLKNKKSFYPSLVVKHQWKEMAATCKDWKKFYLATKNLKLKYRVSLQESKHSWSVFQQNRTVKSLVLNYVFYT